MNSYQMDKKLQQAQACCFEQGGRLTLQRRQVLSILLRSERPMGAYQILEELRGSRPRVAPPTVYRALDFLQQYGLIHKLETLHAYVSCNHPDHVHHSQFLICTGCGVVTELDDAEIAHSVEDAATASGFKPSEDVVEVKGRCAQCSGVRS